MDYLAIIAAEGSRISHIARKGHLDARVPYMAGWRMGDVVAHLGGVHRWAEDIVRRRHFGGEGHRSRRGTETGDALISWFDEGLEALVATLAEVDPAETCSNFSPGSPATVGFWRRRQAHETTMHRWDVEAAVGVHDPIDAQFATDGIDELFHTFTRTRGKQILEAPIRIVTTDTEASWTLAPMSKPGRVDLVDEPTETAASLEGEAKTLLLALWKRVSLQEADVEIGGQREMVRDFVAGPISP